MYVSTVPVDPAVGSYLGGGKATLWALDARTGTPKWSWDEVQDLWGNPSVNSGGGQRDPPSSGRQGDLHIGVSNPGPLGGAPGYPWGTSRPGPDLYTDSVVKLSPQGKLLWYYQLTPHDLNDWDLQDSPLPLLPQTYVAPGALGGIESQLATNGSTTFAAVTNDVMFTTTFSGDLYAVSARTGRILFKTAMSARTNAPVTIDGHYVIAGAGLAAGSQQNLIITYRLGAKGALPGTAGS